MKRRPNNINKLLQDAMARSMKYYVDVVQIKNRQSPLYGAFGGKSEGFESAQLIQGLLARYRETGESRLLESAKLCADWYVRTQIRRKGSPVDGTWLTPHYGKDVVIFPEVIEILGGIFDIYEETHDRRYWDCIERGYRCFQRAKVGDTGQWHNEALLSRIHMDYNFKTKKLSPCLHRAIDDGIDYRYYRATGNRRALEAFRQICDAQKKLQTSDGGFYETYYSSHHTVLMPCGARWSVYWATRPYFYAYDEFHDSEYLRVIERSCRWLVKNQRKDGSFWAWYYPNGEPAYKSVDPCSAGVAVFLWSEYMKRSRTLEFMPCLKRTLPLLAAIKPKDGVRILSFICMAYYSLATSHRF